MQPPTGAITFLFSDIEGSTQRWEHHRAAMRDALAHHDELLRGEIERNGGYVFKTVGDEFCAAFNTPVQAVTAAVEIQRLLQAATFSAVDGLRVRMGLNTGLADERDGDYFGPAVNRTARLMAIANGSQILISAATHALVKKELSVEVSRIEVGVQGLLVLG
jgi:class 3 adenylate cyclase